MAFEQKPPSLGNQYDDDRVLRSYLKRALPEKVLKDIEDELQRPAMRCTWRSVATSRF